MVAKVGEIAAGLRAIFIDCAGIALTQKRAGGGEKVLHAVVGHPDVLR